MTYWLLKSEPDTFGWPHQVAAGDAGAEWHGIRNYQARNNLRAMALGDLAFFYHSNIGREIVGIVQVTGLVRQDSTTDDPRWQSIWVRALHPLPRAVTLAQCKDDPSLQNMALLKNPRLSVQPVTPDEWAKICAMGGMI